MKSALALMSLCGITAVLGGFALLGADPPRREAAPAQPRRAAAAPVDAPHTFRARDVLGMPVRNTANEEIGAVDDLVIDGNTGQVQYAVLTYVSLDNQEQL